MKIGLKGKVRVMVLEEGEPISDSGWQENLILDQGLDKLATLQFNQVFSACAVGTDNSPTTIQPPAGTTATVSGTTLTASAPTFSSADLDSDVLFTTGQHFKIQSVTDPQHVTLFTSGTVSTATGFQILRVNQVILGNEVKRTVNLSNVPAANGWQDLGGSIQLQRTFLFPQETATITYQEIGFSDIATAGSNLFSRIVLAAPITVNGPTGSLPGQQLQVTYQLQAQFDYGAGAGVALGKSGPWTSTPISFVISGLPIQYPIIAFASSPAVAGKIMLTVQPQIACAIGDTVTVTGSPDASYNGTHLVLATSPYGDATGPGLQITLDVADATHPTAAGHVTSSLTGAFWRACYGLFVLNSTGGSAAPPNTADAFYGYGEPSVPGQAWIAKDFGSIMGANQTPARATNFQLAACQLQPYTNGQFYIDKKASFTLDDSDPIYTFGVGLPDLTNQIETFSFDQGQALGAGSVLALTFRFSWGRASYFGPGQAPQPPQQPPGAFHLDSLTPNSGPSDTDVVITATGGGFSANTRVYWNGARIVPVFDSATQVHFAVNTGSSDSNNVWLTDKNDITQTLQFIIF
jgi:IPT/TIG domain